MSTKKCNNGQLDPFVPGARYPMYRCCPTYVVQFGRVDVISKVRKQHHGGFTVTVETRPDSEGMLADFMIEERLCGDPDVVASGTLRWDGCVNWSTGDVHNAHFCEPSHLRRWAGAFELIWTLAKDVLEYNEFGDHDEGCGGVSVGPQAGPSETT